MLESHVSRSEERAGEPAVPFSSDTAAGLRKLHHDTGFGQNARPLMTEVAQAVKSGEVSHPVLESLSKVDQQKIEVNAIATVLIRDIWEELSGSLQLHAPGLGQKRFIEGVPRLVWVEAAEVEAEMAQAETSAQAISILSKYTRQVPGWHVKEWFERHMTRLNELPEEELTYVDRAFRRYNSLLPTLDRVDNDEPSPRSHLMANDILSNGLEAGQEVTFATLSCIPELYFRQFGQRPNGEEVRAIAQASQSFVLLLATSQLGIFNILSGALLNRTAPEFDLDKLELEEKNGTLRLGVKKECLEAALREIEAINGGIGPSKREASLDSVRTGCPAMAADGKNVIVELYQWYMRVADQFYFPNVDGYQFSQTTDSSSAPER